MLCFPAATSINSSRIGSHSAPLGARNVAVLTSLSIRNFVLIADALLECGPGLTVLSGETGAGKTLLTQALGLLRGERAGEGLVGETGDEALIQAVFEVTEQEIAGLPPSLVDLLGVRPGELIATRRLHRTGRNRCFVDGAAITLADLGSLIAGLVSFSGQHEHRRLLEAAYQRVVLDAFAGPSVATMKPAYERAWTEAEAARDALCDGERDRERRARERELLAFQVAELEAAQLSVLEEDALGAELRVLARAGDLRRASAEAAEYVRSDDSGPDAAGLLARARASLVAVSGVDPVCDEMLQSLVDCGHLLDEAVRSLRGYAASIVVDPARQHEVEQRLQLYADLGRKYGGDTATAVAFLEAGAARLFELQAVEDDLERLTRRREAAAAEALRLAAALSAARAQAAPLLETAIEEQLADLGMADTRVSVQVRTEAGWEGLGREGADAAEFRLAPNPGLPPRSLARTASGGELSRTLLAIKAALAGLEGPETLVFDEIDAGIGGRTATSVGYKLRELSRTNQMIVVTHLPQVAAFADRHVLIEKTAGTETTTTRLRALDEPETLDELCRMLGAEAGDPEARAHARSLKDRATAGLID